MVAVIDVADTHANIGRERKVLGQVQLDACHVDSLTPGWHSVTVIDSFQCIVNLILELTLYGSYTRNEKSQP